MGLTGKIRSLCLEWYLEYRDAVRRYACSKSVAALHSRVNLKPTREKDTVGPKGRCDNVSPVGWPLCSCNNFFHQG